MNQVLKFILIIALISIENAVSQKITAIDLPTKDLRKVRRQSPIDFREISLDCRDGMTITIRFAGTFSGVIYSRDHFDNKNCRYIENESRDYYQFTIPFNNECGTKPPCQLCSTLENVIIIQSDPQVLTNNDLARKLSCPIPNDYKKDVFFKPIDINSLEVINVPSEEGNIQCWMNITEGVYPNVKEISRNINIGDTLSIIFHLNDPGKRRQLQIKQCWAYDNDNFDNNNTKKKILTDYNGCPIVDSIGYWKKETNLNRIDATFIAYTTLKAFKFPGSNKVHIKCNIEFCTDNCFDVCSETQNNYCLQNPYDLRCQDQFITPSTEQYRPVNKYSTIKQKIYTQRPIEYTTTSQPIYIGTTKNNIENIDCSRYPYNPACEEYNLGGISKVSKITTTLTPFYTKSQNELEIFPDCKINPYSQECLNCKTNPNRKECKLSSERFGTYSTIKNIPTNKKYYTSTPSTYKNIESNTPRLISITTPGTINCEINPYATGCEINKLSTKKSYNCITNPNLPQCRKTTKFPLKTTKINCNRTPYLPECNNRFPTTTIPFEQTKLLLTTTKPYYSQSQSSFNCNLNPYAPGCLKVSTIPPIIDCINNPNRLECEGYTYDKPNIDSDCELYPDLPKCFQTLIDCNKNPNDYRCKQNIFRPTTSKSVSIQSTYSKIDCNRTPYISECLKPVYERNDEKDTLNCKLNPYTEKCQGRIGISFNCNLYPNSARCKNIENIKNTDCSLNPNNKNCIKYNYNKVTTDRNNIDNIDNIDCRLNPNQLKCNLYSTKKPIQTSLTNLGFEYQNICNKYPNNPECNEYTLSTLRPNNINECTRNPNLPQCQIQTSTLINTATLKSTLRTTDNCLRNPYLPECVKKISQSYNCNISPNAPGCRKDTTIRTSFPETTTLRSYYSTTSIQLNCDKNPYATGCAFKTTKKSFNCLDYPNSAECSSIKTTQIPIIDCSKNPYAKECNGYIYDKPKSPLKPFNFIDCNKYPNEPECKSKTTNINKITTLRPFTETIATLKAECNINPYKPECIKYTTKPQQANILNNKPYSTPLRTTTLRTYYSQSTPIRLNCKQNPYTPECLTLTKNCKEYPNDPECIKSSTFYQSTTTKIPNLTFKPISSSRFDCNRNPYSSECIIATTRKSIDCIAYPNAPNCYKSTNNQITTIKYSTAQQNCDINPNAVGCAQFTTKLSTTINNLCKINPYSPECNGYNYNKPISTQKSYERIDCNQNPYSPQCNRPSITTTKKSSFSSINCLQNPNSPECFRTTTIATITKRPSYEKSTYSQINCYKNPLLPECNKYDYKKPTSLYPDCNLYPNIPECQKYQIVTNKPINFETTRPTSKTIQYFSPEVTTRKSITATATATVTATRLDCSKNTFTAECRTKATIKPYDCKQYPNSPECSLQTIDCSKNPYVKECDGYIYKQPTSGYSNCILYPNTPECKKQITTYSPKVTTFNCRNYPNSPECFSQTSQSSKIDCTRNPYAKECTKYNYAKPTSKYPDCNLYPNVAECKRKITTYAYTTKTTPETLKTIEYFSPKTTTLRPYYSSKIPDQFNCKINPYAIECLEKTTRKPYNCIEYPNDPKCFSQSAIDCSKNPYAKECDGYIYKQSSTLNPFNFLDCNKYPNEPECIRKISTKPPTQYYSSSKTTTFKPYFTQVSTKKFDCSRNPFASECQQQFTRKPIDCKQYPNSLGCPKSITFIQSTTPITSIYTKNIDCNKTPYLSECLRKETPRPFTSINCNVNPNSPECSSKKALTYLPRPSTQQPLFTSTNYFSKEQTSFVRPSYYSTKKTPETFSKSFDCKQYPNSPNCYTSQNIPFTTKKPIYLETTSKKTNCDNDNNQFNPECIRYSSTLTDCSLYPNSKSCSTQQSKFQTFNTQKPFSPQNKLDCRKTPFAPECSNNRYDCTNNPSAPGCYKPSLSTIGPVYKNTGTTRIDCSKNPFNSNCKTYSSSTTNNSPSTSTRIDCSIYPNSPLCKKPYQFYTTNKPLIKNTEFISSTTSPISCDDYPDSLECIRSTSSIYSSTYNPKYSFTEIEQYSSSIKQSDDCNRNPNLPNCKQTTLKIDCNRYPYNQECIQYTTSRTYLPPISTTSKQFYQKTTIDCNKNPYQADCRQYSNKPTAFTSITNRPYNCDLYPNSPECTKFLTNKQINCQNTPYLPECLKYDQNDKFTTQKTFYSSSTSKYNNCAQYPNAPECAGSVTTINTKISNCKQYPFSPECIKTSPSTIINCNEAPYRPECRNSTISNIYSSKKPINCELYPYSEQCLQISINSSPIYKKPTTDRYNCNTNPFAPGCNRFDFTTQSPRPFKTVTRPFTSSKSNTYLPKSSTPQPFTSSFSKNECELFPNNSECQSRTPSVIKDLYTSTSTSIPFCARFPEDKKCLACYPGSPDPDCPQPFRPAVTKVPSTYLPPFK